MSEVRLSPPSWLRAALCVGVLATLGVLSSSTTATPYDQVARIWADEASTTNGMRMGQALALQGDTLVAGAPIYTYPHDTGAAFIFDRTGSTWTQTQRLIPADGLDQGTFGWSVAMDGDTVVVGTPERSYGLGSGRVYVYRKIAGVWVQEQKIVPADGAVGDTFGQDVAIQGDTLVVGSPGDDSPILNAGSVYVYTRSGSTWTLEQKLVRPDGAFADTLGFSVDLDGDRIAAGAPSALTTPHPEGAVHVWSRTGTTWSHQARLMASDAEAGDAFGCQVELDGDTMAVGARLWDGPTATLQGAAYVFVESGGAWAEQQRLTPADGVANDLFGRTMALDGDLLMVGSIDRDGTPQTGAAYLYERGAGGFALLQKLVPAPNGSEPIYPYGYGLAIDGSRLAVGAHDAAWDYVGGIRSGGLVDILECPDANAPPSAVAGADQAIHVGDTVDLDGSGSFDDDTASGDLGYAWSFVSRPAGSSTSLAGATTATPSFTADVVGSYTLQLVVIDEDGVPSAPDTVVVSSENLPPVADAGHPSVVHVNDSVLLDGSDSADPDGDALTYTWTIANAPTGSTVGLVGANTATPTLDPDLEGLYVLRLVVSDGYASSLPDDVEVTVIGTDYALAKLQCASDYLALLDDTAFDAPGHRNSMLNEISRIIRFLQRDDLVLAEKHLVTLLERVDGCEVRGEPDGMGRGKDVAGDYLIDCEDQALVYGCLSDAVNGIRG